MSMNSIEEKTVLVLNKTDLNCIEKDYHTSFTSKARTRNR